MLVLPAGDPLLLARALGAPSRGAGPARCDCVTPDGRTGVALEDPRAGPTAPVAVDVVIVAYNSRDALRDCVGPLLRLTWVSVTVVDNSSPDGSAAVVSDLPIHVIKAPRNGGFAYGCNLGAAAGAAEFVMFLNPDARIDSESLHRLVA